MSEAPAPPPISAAAGTRSVTARADAPASSTLDARTYLAPVGAAALALLTCAFALHQLESFDFWWQLRVGQYITELRQVPTTDPFSSTAQGNPYIDSHWLFQVVLWRVYLAGGINGVILAVAGVAVLTWGVVAGTVRRADAWGITLLALALGIVAASERYQPRPDLPTLLFLALTHLLVLRYRGGGGRAYLLLPVVHLAWVNSHGLWILGPIVVGAYGLGDWLLPKLPVPAGWTAHAMPPERCRRLGLVLLAMLPLTFVTPQPVPQALYPFTLFREIQGAGDWVAQSVTELGAPLADPHWSAATVAFVALACVVLAGCVRFARRLDPVAVVLTLAFAYLALTARRNMALFAVVAVPCVARMPGDLLRLRADRLQVGVAVLAIVLSVGVAFGAATNALAARDRSLTRFGLGLLHTSYPGRVGDFLVATHAPGPVWNTPGLGGYLLWRFWPERAVFVDGRWEVYGQEFMQLYGQTIRSPDAWEHVAQRFHVQAAVILHRQPDYIPLLRHLYAAPDWVLCYADPVAALFVRRTAETAAYVAAHGMRLRAAALPTPLPDEHIVVWEDRYRDRPHLTAVQAALARWPIRRPDASGTALLANLCFVLEEDAAAAALFAATLEADPNNYAAHVSLGYLAEQRGDTAAARAHAAAAARLQ